MGHRAIFGIDIEKLMVESPSSSEVGSVVSNEEELKESEDLANLS